MADTLASLQDLADALQIPIGSLSTGTATLLLETATGVVQQAAGGQRIIQVAGDVCTNLSISDSWADLPQIPVTTVTSVVLDGVTLTLNTDYKVFGNRLWRRQGWQNNLGYQWGLDWGWNWRPWWATNGNQFTGPEPSSLVVTYTHGYASGAQELQLARSAVISLARTAYSNPSGVQSESIDDYSVNYQSARAVTSQMEVTPQVRAALRRQYGRRGGLVRVG